MCCVLVGDGRDLKAFRVADKTWVNWWPLWFLQTFSLIVAVLFWMLKNLPCYFWFTKSVGNTYKTKIMPFWPLCCESEAILSKKFRPFYPGWSVHMEKCSSRLPRSRFFDGPAQPLIWTHRNFCVVKLMWCFYILKLAVHSAPFLSGKENIGNSR